MALVEIEDRGAVRHLILNRPEKRNAMHGELVLAIGIALKEASATADVHCVVLRGAGAMFSSGMDFKALGGLSEEPANLRVFRREILDAWNVAEEMTKPVICEIHGGCIGGAMELVLACAPLAVGLAKRVMDAAAKPGLALTLEQEVAAQQLCAQSADFAEGAKALAERRIPQFAGR